jgi:hypothetical protein
VIDVIVLRQVPTPLDLVGIGLVMLGVAVHRPEAVAAPNRAIEAPAHGLAADRPRFVLESSS